LHDVLRQGVYLVDQYLLSYRVLLLHVFLHALTQGPELQDILQREEAEGFCEGFAVNAFGEGNRFIYPIKFLLRSFDWLGYLPSLASLTGLSRRLTPGRSRWLFVAGNYRTST
jgi:hypothetical protein